MSYQFYGWQTADMAPIDARYSIIRNPRVLYDFLSSVWCAETCAPRMRMDWSEDNRTLGQCSITSFLVQDIFGGEVYGILRPGGNFHCYNVVDGKVFDLTSEQFGGEKLCYENNPRQEREVHFASEEKKQRYELLKMRLNARIPGMNRRNHEVTRVQPLLREDGSLTEPGWSRKLLQVYDRNAIRAPKMRIKEWDYYLVLNDGFAGAFTLSDDGYIGLQSVSLLNFREGWEHTETILNALPMGKFNLPASSDSGTIRYDDGRLAMTFWKGEGKRAIACRFRNFKDGKTFRCRIELEQPDMDTMVIATPWKEKKNAFYYNQKINIMRASGWMKFDGKEYVFNRETDFGTLDWGRGVWTYDNRWYWGSGNGIVEGKPFGFNIGYGFGDTTAASENMLFYDGKGHKLADVTFHIPEGDYMKPWTFTSSDGRFEMDFVPVLDRAAKIDAKVIVSDQHQVFGRMSGKAVLDNGRTLEVKDLMCFAEDVHNRY